VNKVPEKELDSKFRLITIAAKRCEQLHRGARPKFETSSKKWSYVALEEVRQGMIDFEILEEGMEVQVEDYDSDVFLEGDMAAPLDIEPPKVIVTDDDEGDDGADPKQAQAVVEGEDGIDDASSEIEEDED
jgi:DNA-directed RNA polymerase omega subunit